MGRESIYSYGGFDMTSQFSYRMDTIQCFTVDAAASVLLKEKWKMLAEVYTGSVHVEDIVLLWNLWHEILAIRIIQFSCGKDTDIEVLIILMHSYPSLGFK